MDSPDRENQLELFDRRTMSNKTVVVTGASSGLGFSIAKAFLKEGANVLLNARNEARLVEAAGRLGHADRVDSIEVVWPGGERERFEGGPADRRITVRRGEGD